MCLYRKYLFLCNHSQLSAEPLIFCAVAQQQKQQQQQQNRYSKNSLILISCCDEICTHGRGTIRVSRLCDSCNDKKTTMDERFRDVKSKMAELRQHLEEAYGECLKHVEEAGLLSTSPTPSSSSFSSSLSSSLGGEGKKNHHCLENGRGGINSSSERNGDEEAVLDPVAAFLKMKMNEEHSHLMMLGSFV